MLQYFLKGMLLAKARYLAIYFLGSVSLVILTRPALAQIDTEFWFAAPSVTEDHGDRPIVFRLAAFEQAANVTISQPANPDFSQIQVFVNAEESRTVDVSSRVGMVENWPENKVLNKGILISADAPITAYYEVNSDINPDIFSLKGRNALGKQFFVPAQNFWSNASWYSPPATSTIDIVATESVTTISITPSVRTKKHSAGQSFDIVLDRGQTYSLSTTDHEVANQLTGTSIKADKFIAITLKDDSNEFRPCLDLGGDQLVPIDILGTEYIVVKGFLDGGDHVFVLAIEDGTRVTINGSNAPISLQQGEMHDYRLTINAAHIEANKPVYVVHGTGFGCETGLAILPKLECTGSQSVNFTRSTIENFGIILITETGNEDGFSMNGNPELITSADFQEVVGARGRYLAARIDLTNRPIGSRALNVSNSKGSFHLGTINGGYRTGCRYGYFSDFKTLKILTDASKICLGRDLLLKATGSDRLQWFGDPTVDGKTSGEVVVAPEVSTQYGVVGSNGLEGCLDTAYLNVEVFEWPEPQIEIRNPCVNQEVEILYLGDEELERIEWIVGRDTISTTWHDPFVFQPSSLEPVELKVRAITPAGCLVDTIYHFDIRGVQLELDSSISITRGESIELHPKIVLGSLTGSTIEWLPLGGLTCHDCLSPVVSPEIETEYQIRITDSIGCSYLHKVLTYVDEPIFIPNAFTPDHNDINDFFRAYAEHVRYHKMRIFDRWGALIFETDDPATGWDGRVNGEIAPAGTYLYKVQGIHQRSQNQFELNGTVHLIP